MAGELRHYDGITCDQQPRLLPLLYFVAVKTKVFAGVGFFQGRLPGRRMTFHAGDVCRDCSVEIVRGYDGRFIAGEKKKEIENQEITVHHQYRPQRSAADGKIEDLPRDAQDRAFQLLTIRRASGDFRLTFYFPQGFLVLSGLKSSLYHIDKCAGLRYTYFVCIISELNP